MIPNLKFTFLQLTKQMTFCKTGIESGQLGL